MVAHLTFDAYASAYEISGELYFLKSKPEIESVRLLSKIEGDAPKYCLEIVVDDAGLEALQKELERAKSQYTAEISNAKLVIYKVV